MAGGVKSSSSSAAVEMSSSSTLKTLSSGMIGIGAESGREDRGGRGGGETKPSDSSDSEAEELGVRSGRCVGTEVGV